MLPTQAEKANKTGETRKERSNMVKARIAARLSKKALAQILKVDIKTIINWEKAYTTPHLYQIADLREAIKFTGSDEELLQVFLVEQPAQEPIDTEGLKPCHTEPTRDILDSSDSHLFDIDIPEGSGSRGFSFMDALRRLIINTIGVTLVGNVQVFTGPVIEPEESLAQCRIAIDACWEWFNQGKYNKVERSLQQTIPTLKKLATSVWDHQGIAAFLAVQANIMQIILANRNLDFVESEFYCAEAVRFGRLSGNGDILAIALDWQGNTFTICYHRPEKAIPILNDALSHLNSDTPKLIRSSIYSNLSVAHAQNKDEKRARDYIEVAHTAMPTHPERDLFYQCIHWNQSVLDALSGKAYLHLAEHFSNVEYARNACSVLGVSTSEQAMDQGLLSGLLIKRADAARVLGDMNEFVKCLTNGFSIGVNLNGTGHYRRISEANDIIHRVPEKWQKETAVQELQKDISHALIVARQ